MKWYNNQLIDNFLCVIGVQLGLEVRDSCWSAPVALQQSIELVRDAISPISTQQQLLENADSAICRVDTNQVKIILLSKTVYLRTFYKKKKK